MHARVVLGVGKGVLFREVSSVQEREREYLAQHTHSWKLARVEGGKDGETACNAECTRVHLVFMGPGTHDDGCQ